MSRRSANGSSRRGYTKGAKNYFYAEDLGYHESPKRTIRKLMQSDFNREHPRQ